MFNLNGVGGRWFLVLLALLSSCVLQAQTVVLNEGFEGNFPADNGWTVGDDNATAPAAYWEDVNAAFGGEGAHTGGWKGYCAGVGFTGTTAAPQYPNNVTSYMQRTINLAGLSQVNLRFWYKLPSAEAGFDHCRVYVGGTQLWTTDVAVADWTSVVLDLDAYAGTAPVLRFEFSSDGSSVGEGWYLDDILVTASATAVAHRLESMSVTNYTGYVMDADATVADPYNRESLLAQSVVRVEGFGSGALFPFANYVLEYRLVDVATGLRHPIYDASGLTNVDSTYRLTNSFIIAKYGEVYATNVASIRPAAQMDPFTSYRLDCQLLVAEVPTGGVLADGPRAFQHFTNTVSGDAALNVIASLDTAGYSRTYLVDTIPGKNSVLVDTALALRRYDGFEVFPSTDPVTVVLNLELLDAVANTNVPLAYASTSFVYNVQAHTITLVGTPIGPITVNATPVVELHPAAGQQLDSVNKTYRARVTVAHVESLGQPLVTGNRQTLADQRILHFNGHLVFGGVDTLFTSIGNTPSPLVVSAPTSVRTALGVDGGSGRVTAKPTHTYGDGTDLDVLLRPDGTAVFNSGAVVLSAPSPDLDAVKGLRFERLPGTTVLYTAGAHATVRMILPAGFGHQDVTDPDRRLLSPFIDFGTAALTSSLRPSSDLDWTPAVPVWACEETKPFWIETGRFTWLVEAGQIELGATGALQYFRRKQLDDLKSAPVVDPAMAIKRSNEQVFRWINGLSGARPVVSAGSNGAAQLTVALEFLPLGGFETHMPYGVVTEWGGGGSFVVNQDVVDVEQSRLEGVNKMPLDYARDCGTLACAGTVPPSTMVFLPEAARLHFTREAGLAAPGQLDAAQDLQWGAIPPPSPGGPFAHISENYQEAGYHMPGSFELGADNPTSPNQGPAVTLLCGVDPKDLNKVERPTQAAYLDGGGDYAGLNFRVGAAGAHVGASVLAGEPTGEYPLTERSKYYVRPGGVSGIHEAVLHSFPASAKLYGYTVDFDNFGLAFLDSQNVDSRTQGDVVMPYPSDFKQEFEELKFSCVGALDVAKVPAASTNKVLNYWNGDFKTLAIKFEAPTGCDPSVGFLVLGVEAWASHVDQPLYGRLGFRADGNLITPEYAAAHGLSNVTSRLKLPNVIRLRGPVGETYAFTPVTEGYYNNWDDLPTPSGGSPKGFINLAGSLDVQFFKDLKVHLQTSCLRSNTTAPIYLFGGWPSSGWEDPPGKNYFNTALFDANHKGYAGANLAAYRDAPSPAYRVRAQQSWIGVVNLDYPLDWSTTTRSFKSSEPVTDNLTVVQVEHQVRYLSAEHAELTFGIEYDGLPKVNIANLAFNAIDGELGVAQAFANAGLGLVRDQITDGLDSLNTMLNAQVQAFYSQIFDDLINPGVDALYGELIGNFPNPELPGDWQATALTVLDKHLISGVGTPIKQRLKNVVGATTNAVGVLQQIDQTLGKAEGAVGQVEGLLAPDGSGARDKLNDLTKELVGQFAAQFVSFATDGAVDKLFEQVAPQLNAVTNALHEVHDVVSDARSRLGAGQDFATELQTKVNSLTADIDAVAVQIRNDVRDVLYSMETPSGNLFQMYTPAEVKAMIRRKIEDRFFGSQVTMVIQETIKHRVYDADASIRESVDTAFQQVDGVIKDLLQEPLAQLDNSINDMLGDVSDVMGAGKIDGYAHIAGDSLKLLRLDGEFRWKVPEPMEFKAYLQIKELDSDGPPSCSVAGGKTVEVTVGCTDVAIKWLSPDLRASVEGKFAFQTTPAFRPIGMGGGFELTGGLNFEAFKIPELAATMGFGAQEAYLGCRARVLFNKYEFAGGLFFGRTCSIDPLMLVDPDVGSVLGSPPFTGAYVYGEGWFPLNEVIGIPSSCFFNVRAGVGAGAFYFVEGPTYGGKMLLGLSGEVLCIVEIQGQVKMVGVKQGSDLTLKGTGSVSGEIGYCPFCVDFSKSIGLTYKNGSFDLDF